MCTSHMSQPLLLFFEHFQSKAALIFRHVTRNARPVPGFAVLSCPLQTNGGIVQPAGSQLKLMRTVMQLTGSMPTSAAWLSVRWMTQLPALAPASLSSASQAQNRHRRLELTNDSLVDARCRVWTQSRGEGVGRRWWWGSAFFPGRLLYRSALKLKMFDPLLLYFSSVINFATVAKMSWVRFLDDPYCSMYLLLHMKKSFWGKENCSMGSLWVLQLSPTVQKDTCEVNWKL